MKKQAIFAITCTQHMCDGRANVKLYQTFTNEREAIDVLYALRYGYLQSGDDVVMSNDIPNHMSVISDCWKLEYQIVRGSVSM